MTHNHNHPHSHSHTHNERRVGWVAVLTCGFMLVEAVGGVFSGSLTLLADAGHMLADSASLVFAWLAFRMARRPPDWQRTYGFHRLEVLAAGANGLTLVFVALGICYEAVHRLSAPVPVLAGPMLGVAAIGLAVNLVAFAVLHGAERDNLNIRGALLHVLGDLLGSAAAIIAALTILWTGWTPIDPLLSVLVALLILHSAWSLVRDAGHILLEGAPAHLDVRSLKVELAAAIPAVVDVHHVHAWSLTQNRTMMTLHARVLEHTRGDQVTAAIKTFLRERYGIEHATVEIEREACADTVATD